MCIDFKIKLIFCGEYTPREMGVNLKQGYNGDLTSREAGYVGGYMVKRLIEQAEHQMAGQSW